MGGGGRWGGGNVLNISMKNSILRSATAGRKTAQKFKTEKREVQRETERDRETERHTEREREKIT